MTEAPPYIVGGTIEANSPAYVVRPADFALLELCRAGTYAYVLTSRQMGKSSLMVRTAVRLQEEGFEVAAVDLTLIGTNVSEAEWYAGLTLAIELSLSPAARDHERSGPRGYSSPQALIRFFEELLHGNKRRLTVFIDEIDTTLSLGFRDDFFAALRYLYNQRAMNPDLTRLSFVLIGVASPDDLIQDPRRTPFNIGKRVELSDFTLQDCAPLASGLGLPPGKSKYVTAAIRAWTGGHPYLTHRLFAEVAASLAWEQNESRASLEGTLAKWLLELPLGLAAIVVCRWFTGLVAKRTLLWSRGAEDSNLRFVRDMLTRRARDPQAVLMIYARILRPWSSVPNDERSEAVSHLKLAGAVAPRGGYIKVRNRIYRKNLNLEWVYQHLPFELRNRWESRFKVAAFLAVTVCLLWLTPLYWTIRRDDKTLRSLRFARTAESLARTNPETAALIALEALHQRNTAPAENALRVALTGVHEAITLDARKAAWKRSTLRRRNGSRRSTPGSA